MNFNFDSQQVDVSDDGECAKEDVEQTEVLKHVRLSSWAEIERITERQICANCGRKRMYFCYDCRAYIPVVERLAPKVELPVQVDVIKHWLERNGKSTALHCALLAPTSTRIFDAFADVPDYSAADGANTVIVYPSRDALSIDEYVQRHGPIRRFVVLDATWFTVKRLRNLPQLRGVPCVALKTYKTHYWRPQKGFSDEFLSTIEAIYYAICENFEASKHVVRPSGENAILTGMDSLELHNLSPSEKETPRTVPNEHQERRPNASSSPCSAEKNLPGTESIERGGSYHQFDDLLFWFYFFRAKVEPEKRKNNR